MVKDRHYKGCYVYAYHSRADDQVLFDERQRRSRYDGFTHGHLSHTPHTRMPVKPYI